MKKILIVGFVALLSIVLTYGFAVAAISGPCVICHTMHNSQNNAPMNYDSATAPNPVLLRRTSCLGCHARGTSDNIEDSDTTPQVYHTDTNNLAGGNFYSVPANQTRGHNVMGMGAMAQDTLLSAGPPGYISAYDPAATKFNVANPVTCAGSQGCHGNRDNTNQDTAVKGGHHGNDSILKFTTISDVSQGGGTGGTGDITTVYKSYRFLYNVHGGEDADWQDTVSSSDHNEYKGATFAARGQTQGWTAVTTISDLCAECHGKFHAGGLTSDSGIGTASPWLRHPTDAVIPNSGEYASISSTYDPTVPVGRSAAITSCSTAVTVGTDVVTCLSCHSAHGTANDDILKWSYSTITTAGTKCLYCHTGKITY